MELYSNGHFRDFRIRAVTGVVVDWLQIELDGLLDVVQRFVFGVAFADAAGKTWDIHRVAAAAGFENYF